MSDAAPTVDRRWLIPALLLAAATLLRLAWLGSLPPDLFRDEAEKGYNAWCIATTGRDAAGNLLPVFVNVFGVTTSAAYQYLAAPLTLILGLNEWSTRLPAALAGLAAIAVNFLFMQRAFGRGAALWASAFLALSPWHIVFSRWAQQGILLPLLLAVFLLGWQMWMDGRRAGAVLAGLAAGASVYVYDVARLFVPLLLAGAVVVSWRQVARTPLAVAAGAIAAAVAASPVVYLMLTEPGAAQARFEAISIFGDNAGIGAIVRSFSSNYLAHWSPQFLLLSGDAELRHSAGVGHMLAFEFAMLIAGIIFAIRLRTPPLLLLLWGVVLFPVAAGMTKVGVPHALRCIVAIPILQNLAGVGAARLADAAVRRGWRQAPMVAVLLTVLSAIPFALAYFTTYRARSAFNWQYGVREALDIARSAEPPAERIAFYRVTGAEYLVAFRDAIPPGRLRAEGHEGLGVTVLPWDAPLGGVCADMSGVRTAFIMLPMFEAPCGRETLLISGPGGDEVMMTVSFNYEASVAATDAGAEP